MSRNLVRLSRWNNPIVQKSTLYKWRHTRRHPELFVRFGGTVFVDMDRFDKILEEGRGATWRGPRG